MSEKSITAQEKNITEEVLGRVGELKKKGELQVPVNYSAENALKSAYLILQETLDKDKNPVLQTCSRASISSSLLDMVIQGLSPLKKQCYFIAHGKRLQLRRSYMGTISVAKRLEGVKDVKAYCLYEGDEFETEFNVDTGVLRVTKFHPKFENMDNANIKGAFAMIIGDNGPLHTEIMNMAQIKKAWAMSRTYTADSKVHNNFTEEMAKKTVTNRACKRFVNTSDDSDLLVGAFNNSEDKIVEDTDASKIENVEFEVQEEIKNNSATKEIRIDPSDVIVKDTEEQVSNPAEQKPENEEETGGPEF